MKLSEIKKAIKHALETNTLDDIVALAQKDRRTLNVLMKFTYDKESRQTWRAIEAMGLSAQALLASDYDFLRETTRRLIWSVTEESGGIGWSAPELLGEIIRTDPQRFSDLIPVVVSLSEEEIFREGVVYALSRMAHEAPELIAPYSELIHEALSDDNPKLRYYGLLLVEELKLGEAKTVVQDMLADTAVLVLYKDGEFKDGEVGTLAGHVLEVLSSAV